MKTTRRIALSGIMLAFALILSLLENLLPPIIPMLPYAKVGLSNIILLACFLLVGATEGYVVLVLKCLLSAVFAGNISMMIWSLPSALVAYTAMVFLAKTKLFSTTGLSIAGGMLHNFTQILVATIVLEVSVFAYLPYMLLAGGLAGLATGVVCHFAVEAIKPKLKAFAVVSRGESVLGESDEQFDAAEIVDNKISNANSFELLADDEGIRDSSEAVWSSEDDEGIRDSSEAVWSSEIDCKFESNNNNTESNDADAENDKKDAENNDNENNDNESIS